MTLAMKAASRILCLFAFVILSHCPTLADTVVFADGTKIDGIILRTNTAELLILNDYGTVNWPRATVRNITLVPESRSLQSADRLANFKHALFSLSKQPWATDLKQVPATVINEGIMRHVPYLSFRCGSNYEVNVYGDLAHPAAIEAGIYGAASEDGAAKSNCLALIRMLLNQDSDKSALTKLNLQQDFAARDGITFEITPATAVDAYGAWWVSVYSTVELDKARATDAELTQITTSRSTTDNNSWTPTELALARTERPKTVTVTTSSGMVVTNAEVVRVNEGISLIWRRDGAAGVAKLADLSPELRVAFGYDAEKSATADAADQERRKRDWDLEQAQIRQAQIAQETRRSELAAIQPYRSSSFYSAPSYSGGYSKPSGGSVFVRSYTKRDGTFVRSHTRSAPKGRR